MNRYEKRVLRLRNHVLANESGDDMRLTREEGERKADEAAKEDTSDLQVSEEDAQADEEVAGEYPKHTGGGWYELSNGEKVQGKEEAEEKEIRSLEAGE